MKFNKKKSQKQQILEHSDIKTNLAGGISFDLGDKEKLLNLVSTFLISDKYYRDSDQTLDIIIDLIKEIAKKDPEFILQLAYYSRYELNLRSIPIVLLVESSKLEPCYPFTKRYGSKILRRADEIAEAVAYHERRFGKKFSKPFRKVINQRILRLDEYEAIKYYGNERNREWKIRDIIRMTHPKFPSEPEWKEELCKYLLGRPSSDEGINKELKERLSPKLKENYCYNLDSLPKVKLTQEFNKLDDFNEKAKDIIKKTSMDWRRVSSKFGGTKEVWEFLADNMPFMASLRSLKKLLSVKADITPIIKKLTNPQAIKKSRQLPFRFYSARLALIREGYGRSSIKVSDLDKMETGRVIDSLNTALELSIENLPILEGKTLIAVDTSGSMSQSVSDYSMINSIDIATLLASLLFKTIKEQSYVGAFSTEWKQIILSKQDSILTNADKIAQIDVGYSTNAHLVIKDIIKRKLSLDRVVFITDQQFWDTFSRQYWINSTDSKLLGNQAIFYDDWLNYKKMPEGKDALCYFIVVNGYGDTQIPKESKDTLLINGWSEQILKFIKLYEKGSQTQISYITNNYNIENNKDKN